MLNSERHSIVCDMDEDCSCGASLAPSSGPNLYVPGLPPRYAPVTEDTRILRTLDGGALVVDDGSLN
jgi:hypothetical protein